jgi:hypothetical protein
MDAGMILEWSSLLVRIATKVWTRNVELSVPLSKISEQNVNFVSGRGVNAVEQQFPEHQSSS